MNDKDKTKKALKKLLILFVNFVLLYALLRLIIELGVRFRSPMIYYIGTGAYMLAAAGLLIAYFVLNGFSFGKETPTWDELSAGGRWSDEKKADFLRNLPARRAKAKQLLYVLLPIIVTLFVSYMELFLFR